ncbi:MAG: hypothetical protein WC370_00015 [Dehalococcoidales bacterium]|jgi:hypothetical protein
MYTLLGLKYSLMVFTAIVGVVQAAAAYNNLRGLLFFRNKICAYVFAALAVAAPLGVLFCWNYLFEINVVAGSEQAGLFFFSTVGAVIFTVIVSSLVNLKLHSPDAVKLNGLDALRESNFLRLLWERIAGKH